MKILITSGGTREPIDGVRYIGNFSRGTTGAIIADKFRKLEHEVSYIHGTDSKLPMIAGENIEYYSYNDLKEILKDLLRARRFDAVIHLAAVSDYSVSSVLADGQALNVSTEKKIKSDAQELVLKLKRNPKLLRSLKEWSANKNTIVIGFKLTNGLSDPERLEAVQKVFDGGGADWIVHNDKTEIDETNHIATFYGPMGPMANVKTKEELAKELVNICLSYRQGGST